MVNDPNRAAAEAAALILLPFARKANNTLNGSLRYRGQPLTLLATGEETEGRYTILDAVLARGNEPPRHLHRREDQAYYLLEGQMTFTVGNITIPARPSECIFLPRGVPHSYRIETETCRALVLLTPAGLEEFIHKYSRPCSPGASPVSPEMSDDEVFAIAARDYGFEWLPADAATVTKPHYDLENFTPGSQALPTGLDTSLEGGSAGFPTMTSASSFF